MFLCDAPNGASFKVIKVILGKEVGKRLADMGFTEGADGAVVRSGFLRGPLQIRIRGYDILIRRCEAAGIEIEPVGDWSAVVDATRFFGFGHAGRGGRGHGQGAGHGAGPGQGARGRPQGFKAGPRAGVKEGCE
jgi:ferrous iron transport protein A